MKHTFDKTDRQDAQLLADLARVNYLPQVWLAPEEVRQLRRLVRFRQQLVDARRDVKLRIRALAREKRLIARTDDDLLVKKLLTLPGVGLITAVTLRAEIGRFDRFHSGKQLSRFCGLSPRNASSGQRQADAGLIRAGNPQLRATLIELAQRLMQTSHLFRNQPTWARPPPLCQHR